MNFIRSVFQKILSLLRVRTVAGGLEISDEVLRLVYFDGKKWQMAGIRLELGVMEKGKIKNMDAFVASVLALRTKIVGFADRRKRMNVVIALSSVSVYSQTFTLPLVGGRDFEDAVALNVQMLSPVDINQVYPSSELLRRDEETLKIEMLAAYMDKKIADDVIAGLFQAGLIVVGIESRPLALIRILREKGAGIDIEKSYLLVDVDNSGIDFLIARNGQLYFEYANQWAELMDDKGQISEEKFKETLVSSLRQVINFHDQHWKEPLAAIILSAAAFEDQAEKAIQAVSQLAVIRLSLYMGQPVSSEWLVALGCSLRGVRSAGRDKEINLLGEGATDAFKKDQLIHFLNLWRILVPVACALLLLTYGMTAAFLGSTKSAIESQSAYNLATGQQAQEITALEASSTAFNGLVALFQGLETDQRPKYKIFDEITKLAAASSVDLSRVIFEAVDAPIAVSGSAHSEDQIIALKKAVESDPNFGPVNLPLTSIQTTPTGFAFSMTFPLAATAFQ